MPGNFNMKSTEIENIDAGDLFELCVDFLDGKKTYNIGYSMLAGHASEIPNRFMLDEMT